MDDNQIHLMNNNFIQICHHLTKDMISTMHQKVKDKTLEIEHRQKTKWWRRNKVDQEDTLIDVYRANMNQIINLNMFQECGDLIGNSLLGPNKEALTTSQSGPILSLKEIITQAN